MLFASITGAWIETVLGIAAGIGQLFASITGAWIETAITQYKGNATTFASITGAWIETVASSIGLITPFRVHHGRVD